MLFFNVDCIAVKQLMLGVAEMVPRHHGRIKKQQEPASTSVKSGKGGKKKR